MTIKEFLEKNPDLFEVLETPLSHEEFIKTIEESNAQLSRIEIVNGAYTICFE